jgi:hypothetical protein
MNPSYRVKKASSTITRPHQPSLAYGRSPARYTVHLLVEVCRTRLKHFEDHAMKEADVATMDEMIALLEPG